MCLGAFLGKHDDEDFEIGSHLGVDLIPDINDAVIDQEPIAGSSGTVSHKINDRYHDLYDDGDDLDVDLLRFGVNGLESLRHELKKRSIEQR